MKQGFFTCFAGPRVYPLFPGCLGRCQGVPSPGLPALQNAAVTLQTERFLEGSCENMNARHAHRGEEDEKLLRCSPE